MTCPARRPLTRDEIENPAEGARLELLALATHLGVTLAALADAAGISRSSMSRIATNNVWPTTYDREQLKAAVRQHLTSAGATPEQLACAFHMHVSKRAWGKPYEQLQSSYLSAAAAAEEQARLALQQRGRRPANGRTIDNPDPEGLEDMLIPKQTLTPEARRAFKLFANPFDGEVTTEAQMYVGGEIAYVREAVWQCAKTGSFVALVGESGSGKTTIVCDLEARIEADRGSDCIVIRPSVLGMEGNDTRGKAMKSTDILAAIIAKLDPAATIPQTLDARTRKAEKLLTTSTQAGNTHLLVIEEAHSLPDATLKHLKRLHELRHGRRPLLAILLVAQPELALTLKRGLLGGHLREVAQRIELVQFLPLDSELPAYLTHRAQAAGRQLTEFIDADAVDALRGRLTKVDPNSAGAKKRVVSLCYALTINNWMTRLLNEAAGLGVPRITRDVVAAA